MTSTINKIIYNNVEPSFDGYDAAAYSLKLESDIRKKWESSKNAHYYLKIATLGLASYFLADHVSKEELERRITLYRNSSHEIENVTRAIQRIAARSLYKKHREVKSDVQKHLEPQFDSALRTALSLGALWLKQGPSITTGPRGQIIWARTKALYNELHARGFNVFIHAHSYPITLHHELASHFQSMHQSKEFKAHKPEESRRRLRAPGVAQHFANTAAYLQSLLAKFINSGWSMDDNHRETIISCDAIPANDEAYESAQHFFKSNRSIVDTASSTGMTTKAFDSAFINRYLQNSSLRQYATSLFAKARTQLAGVADYGMIRVIAIKKETVEDAKTSYAWRSHAFGRLCTCRHTPNKYGHDEFVHTLREHQQGKYKRCVVNGVPAMPQYRLLASNLDKDPTKMIFTMDCLNTQERGRYRQIFSELEKPLSHLIRLERLSECRSRKELQEVLNGINHHEQSPHYKRGVDEVLDKHRELIDGE